MHGLSAARGGGLRRILAVIPGSARGSHRCAIRSAAAPLPPTGFDMENKSPEQMAALRLAAATADFQALHEIVAKARQNLNQNNWDYIVGGTETETTLRRNRLALDSIAFRPRVLRDVGKIDASVNQLGRRLRLPVVLAPVGALESLHADGAAPVVRA